MGEVNEQDYVDGFVDGYLLACEEDQTGSRVVIENVPPIMSKIRDAAREAYRRKK
jgi:hypothetical protein